MIGYSTDMLFFPATLVEKSNEQTNRRVCQHLSRPQCFDFLRTGGGMYFI